MSRSFKLKKKVNDRDLYSTLEGDVESYEDIAKGSDVCCFSGTAYMGEAPKSPNMFIVATAKGEELTVVPSNSIAVDIPWTADKKKANCQIEARIMRTNAEVVVKASRYIEQGEPLWIEDDSAPPPPPVDDRIVLRQRRSFDKEPVYQLRAHRNIGGNDLIGCFTGTASRSGAIEQGAHQVFNVTTKDGQVFTVSTRDDERSSIQRLPWEAYEDGYKKANCTIEAQLENGQLFVCVYADEDIKHDAEIVIKQPAPAPASAAVVPAPPQAANDDSSETLSEGARRYLFGDQSIVISDDEEEEPESIVISDDEEPSARSEAIVISSDDDEEQPIDNGVYEIVPLDGSALYVDSLRGQLLAKDYIYEEEIVCAITGTAFTPYAFKLHGGRSPAVVYRLNAWTGSGGRRPVIIEFPVGSAAARIPTTTNKNEANCILGAFIDRGEVHVEIFATTTIAPGELLFILENENTRRIAEHQRPDRGTVSVDDTSVFSEPVARSIAALRKERAREIARGRQSVRGRPHRSPAPVEPPQRGGFSWSREQPAPRPRDDESGGVSQSRAGDSETDPVVIDDDPPAPAPQPRLVDVRREEQRQAIAGRRPNFQELLAAIPSAPQRPVAAKPAGRMLPRALAPPEPPSQPPPRAETPPPADESVTDRQSEPRPPRRRKLRARPPPPPPRVQRQRRDPARGYKTAPPIKENAMYLETRRSTIPGAGNGVFTRRDLEKGQVVGSYGGRVVSKEQVLAMPNSEAYIIQIPIEELGGSSADYSLAIDGNPALPESRGHMGNLINDGQPASNNGKKLTNAKIEIIRTGDFTFTGLVTLTKTLRKGEELFIDYGPTYWSDESVSSRPAAPPPAARP